MYKCELCGATENVFGLPFKVPPASLDVWHFEEPFDSCANNPASCQHHTDLRINPQPPGSEAVDGWW